jgi:Fe-S oxidoreductase
MNNVFAPGCALYLYKPKLAEKIHKLLEEHFPGLKEHSTCCHHEPNLPADTRVINICAGCDKRYRTLYEGVSTISFWELLAKRESFPFPDYDGKQMAILDACPTRDQVRVHKAIRTLLKRMNIELIEPERTGTKSTCCGDSFYGGVPVAQVKEQMGKRAAEMPVDDVVVYCVSCIKAIHIGGKQPRYLVDLLFGEETVPGVVEPDLWHAELDEFIAAH